MKGHRDITKGVIILVLFLIFLWVFWIVDLIKFFFFCLFFSSLFLLALVSLTVVQALSVDLHNGCGTPKSASTIYWRGVTTRFPFSWHDKAGKWRVRVHQRFGSAGRSRVRRDSDIPLVRIVSSWVAVVESGKYKTVFGCYFLTALILYWINIYHHTNWPIISYNRIHNSIISFRLYVTSKNEVKIS